MKIYFRLFLILSLLLLNGCITTLSDPMKCALLGKVETDFSVPVNQTIGSFDSTGGFVSSYTKYEPTCKKPKTAQEQEQVDNLQPQAQRIRKNNYLKIFGWMGGFVVVSTLGLALFMISMDRKFQKKQEQRGREVQRWKEKLDKEIEKTLQGISGLNWQWEI